MRCFIWLLFFPGVLCQESPLNIDPETLSAWEGSCVVIPCYIKHTFRGQPLNIISLIWYFGPVYNDNLQEYEGTILHNASRNQPGNMITTGSDFVGRVSFVGDLEWRNCSLKISQLRKKDSGAYLARLYGLAKPKPEQKKWGVQAQVNVMETPPKPKMQDTPWEAKKSVTITCSVPYHCPDEPLRLTLSGLEKRGWTLQEAKEIGKIQTTLTLKPTWKDHNKTLKCLLSHPDGSEISQSALLLKVNHAPEGLELTATPRPTQASPIRAGENLSLECTIKSSYPVAKYHWYKNNEKLNEQTGPKIEFSPIEENDSGTYKCEVTNNVGRSEKQLIIDVQYLPKGTKVTGAPQVINEGDSVVLRCSSRGNPDVYHYEWHKVTQPSVYSTGLELRFEAIRASDSGIYFCIAQNQLGNSSSPPVAVDVRYPPKDVKLTSPDPLPILEGDTLRLNCSAGSSNPLVDRYRWLKNRSPNTAKGSLLIFRMTHRDGGSYNCEACNSVRCSESMPIHVAVLYSPKDVSIGQEPRGKILEGVRVRLNCNVGLANPKELTYVWYKDDLQLSSTDAMWTISKAVPEDSGTYFCEARNTVGKSESSTVTLDVLYGPRNVYVSLSPSEATTEGTNLQLLCMSDAKPMATSYEWSWNDEWKASESSRILSLPKVQVRDSGAYRCRAKNAISIGESEPLHLAVSLSQATVIKRTLIGLGVTLVLLILLALLVFAVRNFRKETDPTTGQTWRASFFVKKAQGENTCRNNRTNGIPTQPSLGFLNQGAEAHVPYATIMLPPSHSKDRTEYACIKGAKLAMAPAEDTVIYSLVQKPMLPAKGDPKNDYENVGKNQEEEIHYSSLMNLARRPYPTDRDSTDTDSESEASIQYASLKH